MVSRQLLFLLALAVLALSSVLIAAFSWAQVVSFSLPLPAVYPALNLFFTVVTIFAVPISRRLVSKFQKQAIRSLLPYLTSLSTLALFAILICSLFYAIPSDIQTCAADTRWRRMFETKNEIAVRRIQSRLRCCGYNSLADRAWPFPSKGVDARTCERTQGYYIACGGLWRQEQQWAAGMTALASLLNWLLMVSCRARLDVVGQDQLTDEQMLLMIYSPPENGLQLGRRPAWLQQGSAASRIQAADENGNGDDNGSTSPSRDRTGQDVRDEFAQTRPETVLG